MEQQLNKALLVNLAKYSEVSAFAKRIYSDGYAEKLNIIYTQIIHSQIDAFTQGQFQKLIQTLKENIIIISNEISNALT